MDPIKEQRKIIGLLIEYEELIAELYQFYAAQFPDYERFWRDLSLAKMRQVDWLKEMIKRVEEGAVFFNLSLYRERSIISSINHVRTQLENIRQGALPLISACSIALDIERAVINSKVFQCFDCESPKLKKILSDLADETNKHCNKIQKTWSLLKTPTK